MISANVVLFAIVGVGIVGVLILLVYLWDRVDALERTRKQDAHSASRSDMADAPPFAGLSGRQLWEEMTGDTEFDGELVLLADVRHRYEAVLVKHIEALFSEGFSDGKIGVDGEPANSRIVTTLRGSVESWIPTECAQELYRIGHEAAKLGGDRTENLRGRLDACCRNLFGMIHITTHRHIVDGLLPAGIPGNEQQAHSS